MAFSTPTNVAAGGAFNLVNGPSVTLASCAFTKDRLYILFGGAHRSGGAGANSNGSVTGTAGGWTLVLDGATFNGGLRRVAAFRYIATATETVTVTYNPDTNTNSCTGFTLFEIASGFDTANPIAQSIGVTAAAALNTGNVSLSSAPAASSLSVSGGMNALDTTGGITPRTNWTELAEFAGTGSSSDSGYLESQYKTALDAEQIASASVPSVNRDWGWIHLEIKAGAIRKPGRFSLLGAGHGAPR